MLMGWNISMLTGIMALVVHESKLYVLSPCVPASASLLFLFHLSPSPFRYMVLVGSGRDGRPTDMQHTFLQ